MRYKLSDNATQLHRTALLKKVKTVSQIFKRAVDGTLLASTYRTLRDEWRFSRMRFVRNPLGYKFAGRPDMQAGTFETSEVAVIRDYLLSSDVFVDVGANIGYFTCLARSTGKYTVAIEPLPDNLRYLYANLQINGWTDGIEIHPVGLANKPGLASLYGGGTGASLLRGWAGTSPHYRRTVPLSTLDILLGGRFTGKRLVIKMDVEGAEYSALQGSISILKMMPRPVWLVEITLSEHRSDNSFNPNFSNTFELFWGLGYRAKAVGPTLLDISEADIREYTGTGKTPQWAKGNYLFCS